MARQIELLDHIRTLIAPCGCISAADMSDDVPGFCRSKSEAAQDIRDGFTEGRMTLDEWRLSAVPKLGCNHQPKWGRP